MRAIEILCILLISISIAQPALAAANITDFSELDKTIQEELNSTHTPGCAVAIISDNKVVYARGFGVANVETGQPVTPETLFLIGSTTKAFTAYTLLSLAEEGKVDINKPLGIYIKDLSPMLSNLTASQLLSHTAGLKDISEPDKAIKACFDVNSGLGEYIHSLNDSSFFTDPGEVFSYSNTGYSLAGYLAQNAGEKPFPDEVDERVLKPLGMNSSTFYLEMALTHPMSMGHISKKVMRPFQYCAPLWPAGYLFSNVLDMSRFAAALMNNGTLNGEQVLSSSIIKEMTTPHARLYSVHPDGSYGYGLMMHSYRGVDVVEHEGNDEGFFCVFKMVPEYRFALIILNNGGSTNMPNTTKKAFELMLPLKPEDLQKPMKMNESEMAGYAGNYSGEDQDAQHTENTTSVMIKDGRLLLKVKDIEVPLEKVGKDQFIITIPGAPEPAYIGFVADKNGRIKYIHNGLRAYPRIEY